MNENEMEDRILAYLLGECSEEEAFEVEKLCRDNPTWQTEKIRLGQVIGLIEESLIGGMEVSLPENECHFSAKQKEEIKALLDKPLPKEEASKEKEEITAKTSKTKNPRLIYWAPLAAAAVAALIAYWGNTEKDNEEKDIASYVSASINEKNISAEITFDAKPIGDFFKSKTSDILPTGEAGVALQELIAESANQTLALRTTSAIKALDQQAVEQLPDGKELMKRIKDNIVSSDQPFSDGFLAFTAKDGAQAFLNDSLSSPPTRIQPEVSPPVPLTASTLIKGSLDRRTRMAKQDQAAALSISQRKPDWKSALAPKEGSQPFLINSPSLIPTRIQPEASPPVPLKAASPRKGSKDRRTRMAEQDQAAASSIPQRKPDWKSVIQAPETSFIFNEKGDSLGKILIHESDSDNEIIFERTNWPNRNRNFKLLPGTYEIRLSEQKSGTLIVKGTLEPSPDSEKYLFIPSQAWELDTEEKRKPLPLDIFNP